MRSFLPSSRNTDGFFKIALRLTSDGRLQNSRPMRIHCLRILHIKLLFVALFILGITNLQAQPADARPVIQYLINNYSTLSKAACDTCIPVIGRPLRKNRPVPFPPIAALNAIPGVDVDVIPGLSAPSFLGGGSPEIKGLVKSVAGMTDAYARSVRKTDLLYFKNGAKGVAVGESGKIYTSALTIPPGPEIHYENPITYYGLFSFNSSPARLPQFNTISNEAVEKAPEEIVMDDEEYENDDREIAYFAIDPENEKIVYAINSRIIARKNPNNGKWEQLNWNIPNGLGEGVWGALAVDYDGNLYVADSAHHVIVKVKFTNSGKAKSWQIIGGKFDVAGFKNDDDGEKARFNMPSGICVDKKGNVYVGDYGNNVIRKIDDDGEVTTYAGSANGQAGKEDNDSWGNAKFDGPKALAYNEETKTLYVVDYNNRTIREINDDREVSTLAGVAGSANPITNPAGFAANFYFMIAFLNRDPDEAKFQNPTGIAVDPSGLGLYVSDGQYIKYVNTYKARFIITSATGDPRANIEVTEGVRLPVLPYGVLMDLSNGSFYGVPVVEWQPTTYTISGSNHLGFNLVNGFVTFEVVDCPAEPDSVTEVKTISPKQLPFKWNGRTFNGSEEAYITLKSSHGCDSVVFMKLSVLGEFHYDCDPYILSFGKQIASIIPTTSGSPIDNYSVTPPLPEGLTLNTKTGEISGTPLAYTSSQQTPAIGPKTARQYPAPWTLKSDYGADITDVKILDCNLNPVFQNTSIFKSLVGSAGLGTGTPGAYTDFSGLGPIKVSTNSNYSVQLSNKLSSSTVPSLNSTAYGTLKFMNSFAVYIDYNRDGDFEDAGERVYISAAPQRDAHTEIFNLNIPVTATPGVTKMRIYCVEATTKLNNYVFYDDRGWPYSVPRTTEQALSFYPYFGNIQAVLGEAKFNQWLDYGEFEDYNIDIVNSSNQAYVVAGSNSIGTTQSVIKIAVNDPSASTTNITICSTELPYIWNGKVFAQAESQTAHLINQYGADSAATLNLSVKQATSSVIAVAHCGPYTYQGIVYTQSGDYSVHLTNSVGCDSAVIFRFRQLATTSTTNLDITPSQLPYVWNGLTFTNAGIKTAKFVNAEGCDSTATLNLRVIYNIYYPANNNLEINKPMLAISPQIEGNYSSGGSTDNSNGYYISPALPNGLWLNPITGVISGTPTQLSPLRSYTVTLYQDGAKPSTFNLSVGVPTTSTSIVNNCGPYTWNGVEYTSPTTVSATFKNQYGFDSTATLVLSIRNTSATVTHLFANQSELPLSWNDINITKEGTKTIYLVNAVGCDSAVTVNVVLDPKVVYQSPQILLANQPIAPISPESTGGVIPTDIGIVSTLIKTNFLSPLSVVLDAQDNKYLSNEQNGLIYKISRSGEVTTVEGFGTTNALLAIDDAGNLYVADRISNRILKKNVSGIVTVLANASTPNGIAVDAFGNVYFSEGRYHRIRKINSSGIVSTLAGGTTTGYVDGNGTTAKFSSPSGLAVDKDGNVYVADLGNNRIRKITPSGDVTTFAGNGNAASLDGISSAAGFASPIDIAIDNWGNKYIAENGPSKIRKIDTTGTVSTLAGTVVGYENGSSQQAKFNLPNGITTDTHGHVYVADKGNSAIRQINAINYTIQPALVNGLHFDEATGVISGTPTDTLIQPLTYTVRAFNRADADTAQIVLGICNPIETSFTLDTCDQYIWNDSTYTTSTIHTRHLTNKGGCDSIVTMHLIIRYGSTGPTTTATACESYTWEGSTYTKSGLYTKKYPNSVGCDSTIFLNLIIKPASSTNLFVDINESQLPYTWKDKIFTTPGTQSILLVNSVGCDSTVYMTVRISNDLPNISYATKDTILYWGREIEEPIAMNNTGTPVPKLKIGERDTLIHFSNDGPGDYLRHTLKGLDGAYYTHDFYSTKISKLSQSGTWSVFAELGNTIRGMTIDKSGNIYVALNEIPTRVKRITPDGAVSELSGSPLFFGIDAMAIDADNNLLVARFMIDNQLRITKFNLVSNQSADIQIDYSQYIGLGELDIKTDSKGNIYLYTNLRHSILKIKPSGQLLGLGNKDGSYSEVKAGNGTDARIPSISSMAIDTTNDNVYVMAYGNILRIDTSQNVIPLTRNWYEQWKDQIFSVDSGRLSVINNSNRIVFTANVHGVSSFPFMDNYGGGHLSTGKPIFNDFGNRIRLDSTGAIVGTPKGFLSNSGNLLVSNTATSYSIMAVNQYGISTFPMVIRTKSITSVYETFVTTSFPFEWRGRTFYAPTDTATYFVATNTMNNDTLFTLHLLYEVPEPIITTNGNCEEGKINIAAASASKNAIEFDGTNFANIKNRSVGGIVGIINQNNYVKPDNTNGYNPTTSIDVWIKPSSTNGIQYILSRDTVPSHSSFYGLSIQNGKLVYEVKNGLPAIHHILTSNSTIQPNVWTHVVASFYDSALHIYINGKPDGFLQATGGFFAVTYSDTVNFDIFFPDFCVGGLGHQYGFKGEMDELRVWNSKRNEASILATKNLLANPLAEDLALYYRFDGDINNVGKDLGKYHREALFIKPPTITSSSRAPINFHSYEWMPGGATTHSIEVNPATSTNYTLTVTDYKGTPGSTSLIVSPVANETIETISVCGSSYEWNGNTYTSSTSTATWKGLNQYGCDSTVKLHLTLHPLPTPVIAGENKICKGSSATLSAEGFKTYAWSPGGENSATITVQPDTTTTYTLTVTDANGCESTVSKTIVISQPTLFTEKIVACESYTWHGNTYTSSNNTAIWIGANADGCDSVVTLNLHINPLPTPTIVAANGAINCEGNPVQLTARASGNQLSLDGNSRVVVDEMGVDPTNGFTLEAWVNFSAIGTAQSIISQTSNNAPLPFDAWLNANGTVSFAVGNGSNTSNITTAASLAANNWHHVAFVYNNNNIAVYIDGVSSASGAAIVPVSGKLNNFMIGNNESLLRPMNGAIDEVRVWNLALSSGQITSRKNLAVKADSEGLVANYKFDETDEDLPVNSANASTTAIVVGNATYKPSTAPIQYQSYTWAGSLTTPIITVIDPALNQTLTVTDVNGCSATITGKAIVASPSAFTEVVKACGSYTWHGVTYTSSNNTAQWVTKNAAGCESVVTLNLTISTPSSSVETAVACNYFVWHGTTYTSSTNNATWVTQNAAGCDSIVTLHLTITKAQEYTDTITACGTYTWHDSTYTSSTNAPVWYGVSANGCDSIVHLNLTIVDFPLARIGALNEGNDVCQGTGILLYNASENFTTYATGVNIFSSEMAEDLNQQLIGTPNTYPEYGDFATAWSTKDDQPRREFVELNFNNNKPINFIDIYETLNSGTVDTVYVKNPGTNAFEIVYTGTAELYNLPLQNRISFPLTNFPVSTIRIAINSVDKPAQKSIDAVAIGVSNTNTYKWSDGSSGNNLPINEAGTYLLTATNEFGCSASDTFNLSTEDLRLLTGRLILATANRTDSKNVVAGVITEFVKDCELITSIESTDGASAVSGEVTAKVWLDQNLPTLDGHSFVRRHYEITPENNADNATGTIDLYFTQSEFDELNATNLNGPQLPNHPNDEAGKLNFAIYKFNGISNNGTGLPDSYEQPSELILEPAISLVWDDVNLYWKASFTTTGFGGYFAGTPQIWYLDADNDGYYVSTKLSAVNPGAGYNQTATTFGDCDDADNTKWQSATLYIDADNDGFDAGTHVVCYGAAVPTGYKTNTLGSDCDDSNAAINPNTVWYKDADNDGYSDGKTLIQCTAPAGYKLASALSAISVDCDDSNAAVNPGATEICGNGIDDNCNGQVDENCTIYTWFLDADGDGFGNPNSSTTTYTNTAPTGYVSNNTDCNDADAAINPNTVWYKDVDNDGYSDGTTLTQCIAPAGYKLASALSATSGDCDDTNAAINPNTVWYKDADNDGYSDGITVTQCISPAGYKLGSALLDNRVDCDDNNASINSTFAFYVDTDGDGYGSGQALQVCAVNATTPPAGYSVNNTDCAPEDATKWQSATLFIDADNDGYDAGTQTVCYGATIPAGYKTNTLGADCNDNNAAINPNTVWYKDADNDGYSDGTTLTQCNQPAGYKLASALLGNGIDCNDNNASIHPGATEICGNNVDDNCDGRIDEDCVIDPCNGVIGVLYVNAAATTSGSGKGWSCAIKELSDAVIMANQNTTIKQIWVAKGVYKPTKGNNRMASINITRGDLQIIGGFNGTETSASASNPLVNITSISGDIGVPGNMADNSLHLLRIANLPSNNKGVQIEGFLLEKGNANINNLLFITESYGGAAFIYNNHPNTTIAFKKCLFEGNSSAVYGGAMAIYNSKVSIDTVAFWNNTSAAGGAVFILGRSPAFNRTAFVSNKATLGNGGAVLSVQSSPNFTSTAFNLNTSNYQGGAVSQYGGTIVYKQTVFNGNKASLEGGAIHQHYGSSSLTNSTLFENSANSNGGAIVLDNSTAATFRNNIFWRNKKAGAENVGGADIATKGNKVTMQYNLLQSGTSIPVDNGGTIKNNLRGIDPKFENAAAPAGSDGWFMYLNDGLLLSNTSPAINKGYNTYANGITTDMLGKPRVACGTVDLGAYETQNCTATIVQSNIKQSVTNALATSPFNDRLLLQYTGSAKADVEIVSATGQFMWKGTAILKGQTVVQTAAWSSGIYQVTFRVANEQPIVLKVLKVN
jgi:sugar lactone lactonase YvrE